MSVSITFTEEEWRLMMTALSSLINANHGEAMNPYTEPDMKKFCSDRAGRARQLRSRLIDAKVIDAQTDPA